MTVLVLVVEDDSAMRTALADNLEFEGYRVACADNGRDGLALALADEPDLVLLDLMLPGQDGVAVCRALRQAGRTMPVLMLTARGQEHDKVIGLDAGADDYVTKPFSVAELLARVRAALRRAEGRTAPIRLGDWEADLQAGTLVGEARRVELPQREAGILRALAARRGCPVSRDVLAQAAWGDERQPNTRTIDNLVMQLRQRIEPDPANPRWILTAHGVGYRLANQ